MPAESAGSAADLAMVVYPQRLPIMELMDETERRIKAKWTSFDHEGRQAFQPVFKAMAAVHQAADSDVTTLSSAEFHSRIRAAIERLRKVCGEAAQGQLLPCLLSWSPAS